MRNRLFMKNICSITLIFIGIITMLYPSIRNLYYDSKQNEIMESYIESMNIVEVTQDDNNQHVNFVEHNNIDEEIQKSTNKSKYESKSKETLQSNKNWPVESILIIEKIDLFMPVIKGATKEHLNVSVASINNTGKPWESNNYAIAGHRSRTFGRHFNRLDELEIDDEILVMDTTNNEFLYKVYGKKIVEETEISVLENQNKSELTLITCHPINVRNPSTRLVVKAIQIN